jgi:hypothetical protein
VNHKTASVVSIAVEPDETGAVTVPVESQEDLFSHGFVGAPPVDEQPEEPTKPATAKASAKPVRT